MSEAVIDFASMEAPPLETSVESTPSVEETTATGENQATEETPTGEPGGQTEKPAGKGGAAPLKAIRDAVKAFEQTNPELGKHLKSLLDNEGRFRAYQGEFPDVESARTLKSAVESAGGLEEIAKLTALKGSVEEIDAMIENGDPEVLERMFSEAKEGAAKLLPHFMNRVEKDNPQAFAGAVKPHLVRSLDGAGFPTVVGGILRALSGGGTAEQKLAAISESVESMAQWYDAQKRDAEKSNLDSLEPERGKLKEEWSKVTSEKQKIFENEVNAEVIPHMHKLFAEQMSAYSKALAALPSDAMRQNVAKAWLEEIGKAFGKQHHDHMSTMMKSKSRNKTAISGYAKTRMSAVASEVTRKIVDAYKLTPGKAAPRPAGGGGGNEAAAPQTGVGSVSSPIRVKDRPADSNIDWEADPDRMHFITGKAKLLSGSKQWVKWR